MSRHMSRRAETHEPAAQTRAAEKERRQAELPGADDDPEQAPRQEQEEREALKHLRRERREGK